MAQLEWVKEHVRRYKESNGVDGHIWDGLNGAARYPGNFPTLLLTTIGHQSDQPRTTPLIYGKNGENFIVIGSQGGRPNHPSWYLNLKANPKVELQVVADIFPATANTISGIKRKQLWSMMLKIYTPYNDYQLNASATREIPLISLQPT